MGEEKGKGKKGDYREDKKIGRVGRVEWGGGRTFFFCVSGIVSVFFKLFYKEFGWR